MTSATATGAQTVQLTFATPEPDLPFLLSQYQDLGQIIGPTGLADPGALATTSDGAGPYVLDAAATVTNSQYTFTAAPHYWNPTAVHYRQVVVKVIPDPQSALSSLESGQADVLTGLPAVAAKAAQGAGFTTYSEPFSIASLIMMERSGDSPLAKLQVRQAINDAINRPALATGLGGGNAIPTDEVAIPNTTGYDPSLASYYSYDVGKAKQLMASAGYAQGFTLPVLDCLALDPNGNLGAALKSELSAIGITVNLTEEPSPAQFIPASLSKSYPAVIWPISQNGLGFPYSVQFALAPFTNVFNTTSSQLDSLMATAGGQPADAQPEAYQKVNDFLVDNAWYAPVYSLDTTFVIGKKVANVTAPTVDNTTIDPVGMSASTSWYPAP
jgi:peptide/nickel transport system substrate-binding protein